MTENVRNELDCWITNEFQDVLRLSAETSIDENMTAPITPTSILRPEGYDILPATSEDKEEILSFLRLFFFKDEPLNKYLGLISADSPICHDLEDFSMHDIDNGLNLKAICNGQLIGVCLNGVLEKGHDDHDQNIADPNFLKINRLLRHVSKESDVFARFPGSDKAMTVKIISVDIAFRGKGLAKELMKRTRNLAKELGCGFMSVDCTSYFSAVALEKLGFELHYSLKYADYKENGQVVLKPEHPHEALTVYVQKL